ASRRYGRSRDRGARSPRRSDRSAYGSRPDSTPIGVSIHHRGWVSNLSAALTARSQPLRSVRPVKAVGVGLLPTVLCAALASAAQAQPGEIVFASNRSPELLVLHRYSIGVDGTGRHALGTAAGLLSP